MMRAVPPDLGGRRRPPSLGRSAAAVSTPTPIRWSRALATLLAGLLAVGAVVAAGYAAPAVLSQAPGRSGAICGSAWRFHAGSGTQVAAGELSPQQRAKASQECAASGDADWQRGVRFARLAAGAAGAALVLALWSRFSRAVPGPPRRPSDRPVNREGFPP